MLTLAFSYLKHFYKQFQLQLPITKFGRNIVPVNIVDPEMCHIHLRLLFFNLVQTFKVHAVQMLLPFNAK